MIVHLPVLVAATLGALPAPALPATHTEAPPPARPSLDTAPTPASRPGQSFTLGHVTVTRLADGVYAAIRTEPLSLAVNANSLFIVNDADVVVVDAQFTRMATIENIAALRRITSKPVSYVINTHWHDDHVAGNQVYRDTFPDVRFIAQANTRADLQTKGRDNRRDQVRYAPAVAAHYQKLLDMGLGIDSTPATPMERAAVSSALAIIGQYVAENEGFREVLPDTVVDRRMTLVRGRRTIELRWFGRGNTRGDLVTYLPADGIVSTGDLVVAPVPFAFGSYPGEWIAVLDSITALSPRVIVPGHGPIMRDLGYVRTVRRMLSTARERTAAEVARGATAEDAAKAVTLTDLRDEIAGSEKWMRTMFEQFFRAPVVARAWEEAKNGTLK